MGPCEHGQPEEDFLDPLYRFCRLSSSTRGLYIVPSLAMMGLKLSPQLPASPGQKMSENVRKWLGRVWKLDTSESSTRDAQADSLESK